MTHTTARPICLSFRLSRSIALSLSVSLLACFCLAGCTAPAPTGSGVQEQGIDEEMAAAKNDIVMMLSQWGSGYRDLDMARVASFYSSSPDFEWIEEGEVRYHSKQEIQESLEGLAGVKSLDFELIDPHVEVLSKDQATLSALFSQSMDFGSGEPFVLKGAMTAILHKTEEGWRFLRGHTSTIRPD